MALTYTQLVALVRSWCNRDDEVVSDAIIQDALKYAADKAYRTLRVPPLENVAVYSKTLLEAATTTAGVTPSVTEILIPYDLVEFIQLKEKDSSGATLRVFNEKLNVRTFNNPYAEVYSGYNYWTRERNVIKFSAGFATQAEAVAAGGVQTNGYFIGNATPNWLRDENERILLFGALAEVFSFVQEDDQAAKYQAMFMNEIRELNDEDVRRNASGGNYQMQFNGRGLI